MKLISGFLISVFCLGFFPATAAETAPEKILATIERVAGWQLRNPCNVDIRWHDPAKPGLHHIRFAWDGTLLRRRVVALEEEFGGDLPDAWRSVAKTVAGNISFAALPPAIQQAWQREVGLSPEHIVKLKLMDEGATRGWEMATLYHGMIALAEVSPRPAYRDALRTMAEAQHWELAPRFYHADDVPVGYLYLDFYQRERRVDQIAAVQSRLDWILKHPSHQSIDILKGQDRWTWSDALFMAPPVWLKLTNLTGDRRYLEFMDAEWWATTDFLFSKEDSLYFRDSKFFTQREPNGEKIFWSRGNAWVLASLALMLDEIPKDLPSRPKYVALFQAMAARIASLQPEDNLWRSSLLDPKASPHPESSSTAFFCYAFAKGVRSGYLPAEKYRPIVDRTWAALERCVNADGRFGFVQQPGAAPGSADANSSAPYGTGAFLMAGAEVYALSHGLTEKK